jgi:hypothetical protein
MIRKTATQLLVGLAGLAAMAGRVAAHEEHSSHESTLVLPVAIFGVSLGIVGVGLYLDVRDDVEDAYADAGVFIGVAGVLIGIGLFLF